MHLSLFSKFYQYTDFKCFKFFETRRIFQNQFLDDIHVQQIINFHYKILHQMAATCLLSLLFIISTSDANLVQ